MGTRREHVRAATVEEIKATALRLMRESGTTTVRFSDIAREMGMTAPALYRYFATREELVTALVVDAYDELARTVAAARDEHPDADVATRMTALCQAYRDWASADTERFALLFGTPSGETGPLGGPATEAAQRAFAPFFALVEETRRAGQLRPAGPPLDPALAGDLCTPGWGDGMPPEVHRNILVAWAALHGFTCLEAFGHLHDLGQPARDALFAAQLRVMAQACGLPVPVEAGAGAMA